MFDDTTFRETIRRVRAGDQQVAVELVRKFEPLIRREVRLRLEDIDLRRVFDSMDICQSVLASFFVRAAAGEYDLDRPEQLIRLLVRMTRNKVASAARKQYQDCRDTRKTVHDEATLEGIAGLDQGPSQQLAHEELLVALRGQMTPDVRQLAELRAEGLSWDEIAERLGGKAQARRMQLTRGVERACKELGLRELLYE
jgi:RNA polymerase sigma-70 factor (ECF subfamily)